MKRDCSDLRWYIWLDAVPKASNDTRAAVGIRPRPVTELETERVCGWGRGCLKEETKNYIEFIFYSPHGNIHFNDYRLGSSPSMLAAHDRNPLVHYRNH